MKETSEIQSFYNGKTIFITGGSGLMGKVLVEKLLYSCSDLDKIYMLLRPKRGRTPDMRIDDMFKLPIFSRIRKEKPAIMKKLVAVQGDVSIENLGISDEQRERLIGEVNVVFHCAATLRLEAKLKDAVEMNTSHLKFTLRGEANSDYGKKYHTILSGNGRTQCPCLLHFLTLDNEQPDLEIGTASMLKLAKGMKNLDAFVHLSTAFCHIDQDELGERVYDAPVDPQDIMRLVKWLDESSIDLITPRLLEPHPNTYTYSKRLAETLVSNEYPNLPCVIVRPSIVTPAWQEPLAGWVDNLNGPVGLIVAAGKGVIRSMHCNANYHAEVIPVDIAINALIAIARKIGTTSVRPTSMPVYNITQSGVMPITWGQVLEKGKKVAHEYPFEGAVWYPDGDIRANKFVHQLFVIFFHVLPAYFIDFLMLVFRQKRFMVRIQKRIADGLEVLQYFTTREWIFHNTNLLILWNEMSAMDKRLFPVDFLQIDIMNYLKDVILGARQYCMKEKLETLPRARVHQKILYAIHVTAVYSFYIGILYLVYQHFGAARSCLDFVSDRIKTLPILGNVLDKAHL